MRPQNLIVLLAAMASARPVAHTGSNSIEARELEYSEIEALYIERDRSEARRHHAGDHMPSHEDAWPYEGGRFPHEHHRGNGHHGHHQPHEIEEFGHPHDHHHGGPHHDVLDNIFGFLAHQVRRSVPDASARVLDGIRDFLSQETRDVQEREHHHHHPRHPHPGHEIGRQILDFFASAAR